jgi:hypothetical protein
MADGDKFDIECIYAYPKTVSPRTVRQRQDERRECESSFH